MAQHPMIGRRVKLGGSPHECLFRSTMLQEVAQWYRTAESSRLSFLLQIGISAEALAVAVMKSHSPPSDSIRLTSYELLDNISLPSATAKGVQFELRVAQTPRTALFTSCAVDRTHASDSCERISMSVCSQCKWDSLVEGSRNMHWSPPSLRRASPEVAQCFSGISNGTNVTLEYDTSRVQVDVCDRPGDLCVRLSFIAPLSSAERRLLVHPLIIAEVLHLVQDRLVVGPSESAATADRLWPFNFIFWGQPHRESIQALLDGGKAVMYMHCRLLHAATDDRRPQFAATIFDADYLACLRIEGGGNHCRSPTDGSVETLQATTHLPVDPMACFGGDILKDNS
eukprot:GHVT01064683.1.p1 GENE.GHVT01064683.1~~GHVT01064683.1.p1  ORF type:complete len:392 (+),score=37.62 GHVT01064683.1:155-1177(+)